MAKNGRGRPKLRSDAEKRELALRRHLRRRGVKQAYEHRPKLNGDFFYPGDDLLNEFLAMAEEPILASCDVRHLKKIIATNKRNFWHAERPMNYDDILTGKVPRKPEIAGPLERLQLKEPVGSVFVCERLEEQLNVHRYLISLREALKPGGLLGLVVPNAHYELVDRHFNLFTAGTLVYNFIRAGWNCAEARISYDGRFLNMLLPRVDIEGSWPERVDTIAPFTPFRNVFQYCSGEFVEVYKAYFPEFSE